MADREALHKAIKRSGHRDKRIWNMGVGSDPPERTRRTAIRNIKHEYAPSYWERMTVQGAPTPSEPRADRWCDGGTSRRKTGRITGRARSGI